MLRCIGIFLYYYHYPEFVLFRNCYLLEEDLLLIKRIILFWVYGKQENYYLGYTVKQK